ncbi:type-F conjugative transfer system pilin assembly protein TrbC [Tritonibacter scottomollicae]|uniref:Conjugal transfer pilus assembly protein TrbC n=1 Tax=Tritonibacter scottomollicae TaxID=483013 RepID=A0A2T1AAG6_TRISK|nr:type-F conjugative transfer system pilin assembly protein TrbC [Tritonibacter scottomollicae]PRZ45591.1 conjugal transfer pilus assembly protein TrbC [Tritonibacter scottomollicae]
MLRTLSFALAASAALTSPVLAQDDEDKVIDYAPGSTGRITAPLATIVDDAKRQGEALRETLIPQDAAEGAFSGVDFEDLRTKALSHPRVKALLGANGAGVSGAEGDEVRYDGSTVFLLASFSMPKASLRQMMEEASTYGLPIVFRGFVNNSVYETRAALEETFGSMDDAVGFSIDPTVFARFGVTSAPQVIAMGEAVDVCETPGCENDPVPPHDRVGGNVPVEFALRMIADQGDVAAAEAARLLQEAHDAQ